jgi:hypothetical protein
MLETRHRDQMFRNLDFENLGKVFFLKYDPFDVHDPLSLLYFKNGFSGFSTEKPFTKTSKTAIFGSFDPIAGP